MAESYLRPDLVFKVPIEGGELRLSPAFDRIDSFPPLGAFMLKYWDADGKGMCNIMLTAPGATFLRSQCGLYIIERDYITYSEHESLLNYQAANLDETDLGL